MSKLTPKQEAFAKAYIETGNASEAYRRAYNAAKMKDQAVHVKASELLKHGKVAVRISELQAGHQKRHEVTVDSLTKLLMEDRELARSEKEASTAINAVMSIAKLHGMVTEKKNVTTNNKHHLSADLVSEDTEWLESMLRDAEGGSAKAALPN